MGEVSISEELFLYYFFQGRGLALDFFESAAALVQCLRAPLLCVSAQARGKYCEHRAVSLPHVPPALPRFQE